ncbi:MAG: hypothetical protein ABI621_00835 [Chloroflexota bacterium]
MPNIVSPSQSKVRSFIPPWPGNGWGIVGTLAILYTVINIVWTYFHWGGLQYVSLITNLLSMSPALLAALPAWYAAHVLDAFLQVVGVKAHSPTPGNDKQLTFAASTRLL